MTTFRKCAASFIETDIDEEKVVMSLDTGEFFSLKDAARDIWGLLDERCDVGQLLAGLADAYGVQQDVISPDVNQFLAELLAAGLVERA